jgi:predicted component of type VI protein secretion system
MDKFYLKFNAAIIKEIPITKDVYTIGRKPDNDIVIDNPAISGHHARIIKRGESYFVEDLNSTNGTFINDKKIITAEIHHKDGVLIASHIIELFEDKPAPAMNADATVVMDPQKQKEFLAGLQQQKQQAASAPSVPPVSVHAPSPTPVPEMSPGGAPSIKSAMLKVVSGGVDQVEVELTQVVTYIGAAEQAHVRIKGMFAPRIAAAINKRAEGYLLKAVKEGYPKVNEKAIQESVLLQDGDMIETGGTKMVFMFRDK